MMTRARRLTPSLPITELNPTIAALAEEATTSRYRRQSRLDKGRSTRHQIPDSAILSLIYIYSPTYKILTVA
jgi:hypothetical protein